MIKYLGCLGCDFFELMAVFLHLHKTVLNLFSFASPCFAVICVFVAKKVISLYGCTYTHYKMTIFYLCVRIMTVTRAGAIRAVAKAVSKSRENEKKRKSAARKPK